MLLVGDPSLEGKSLIRSLIDSEVKAELLLLFHQNPHLADSLEGLTAKVSKPAIEIREGLNEFVKIGLIKETRLYSLDRDVAARIQEEIASQLNLSALMAEESPKAMSRSTTGILFIDAILPEGLPIPSATVVVGDAGSGKTLLCQQMLLRSLEQGRAGIYLALDNFPSQIRNTLAMLGCNLEQYEAQNKLLLVDCYSSLIGKKSSEKFSSDSSGPVDLNILVSKAFAAVEEESPIMVLDSLSTLFQRVGIKPSILFLDNLVAKVRAANAVLLVKLGRRAFHPAIIATVEEMMDGVIEMKIDEDTDVIERSLRVFKMRGTSHKTNWVKYEIDSREGLVPVP